MSMTSYVILKGKKVNVITQKYQVGLYVAIYEGSRILEQFGLDVDEQKFHSDLRKKYKQWKKNPPLTWTGEAGRRPARSRRPFFTGRRSKTPQGRGIYRAFPHLHPSVRGNTPMTEKQAREKVLKYFPNRKIVESDSPFGYYIYEFDDGTVIKINYKGHIKNLTKEIYGHNPALRGTLTHLKVRNPFKSKAQQRFMFRRHPKIARRWAKVTDFSKLPERVGHNPHQNVEVWDNGGKTWDRYTVFIGSSVYGMSENAMQPNGFNQYVGDVPAVKSGKHLGKRVSYKSLPTQVKLAITNRMYPDNPKSRRYPKKGRHARTVRALRRAFKRPAVLASGRTRREEQEFKELYGYPMSKNPVYNKPVEIYNKILAIEAVKGKQSHWKNQPFVHKFGRSKSKIYGMPDGSLVIKGKKRLWAKKRYN